MHIKDRILYSLIFGLIFTILMVNLFDTYSKIDPNIVFLTIFASAFVYFLMVLIFPFGGRSNNSE